MGELCGVCCKSFREIDCIITAPHCIFFQVDFANVWQQLQAGMKFEPAQPPKSAPASSSINSQQGQGQSQGHFTTAPSLQQAAKVLHVSQLEAPVSNPGASASSSEGTDEFSKLMKSLELSEKKQPSPSKSEASTASSAAEIEVSI